MTPTLEDLARAKSDVKGIFINLRRHAEEYAGADSDCRSSKDIVYVFDGIDKAAALLESFSADARKTEAWKEAAKTYYVEYFDLVSFLG